MSKIFSAELWKTRKTELERMLDIESTPSLNLLKEFYYLVLYVRFYVGDPDLIMFPFTSIVSLIWCWSLRNSSLASLFLVFGAVALGLLINRELSLTFFELLMLFRSSLFRLSPDFYNLLFLFWLLLSRILDPFSLLEDNLLFWL
jgi:hypothetical protein